MTLPSKKEFQDLIDYCNQDRFTYSIVILNDKKGEKRTILDEFTTPETLSDLNKFPAYQWLTISNKTHFDVVMELLFTKISIRLYYTKRTR